MNVNAAAILLAALIFAASMLGFWLMLRAELSAFRADDSACKSEVHADLDEMRVVFNEIRAENQTLGEKIDAIAYILDTRLDGIEREQARLQSVISVLQEAAGVVARSVEDP